MSTFNHIASRAEHLAVLDDDNKGIEKINSETNVIENIITILKPELKNLALGNMVSAVWSQRLECVIITFPIFEVYLEQVEGRLFGVYAEKGMHQPLVSFHSSKMKQLWHSLHV